MDNQFLDLLYQIKPYKIVESPPPLKKKSCSTIQGQSHLHFNRTFSDNPHNHTPNKENVQKDRIVESEMFSSLSSSIDSLFNKIEKIKEQFKCQLSNSEKGSMKKATPIKMPLVETTNFQVSLKDEKKQKQEWDKMMVKGIKQEKLTELNSKARPVQSFDLGAEEIKQTEKKQNILEESFNQIKDFQLKGLSMADFELGKCVGSGKFGDVHICRHKPTGFILALKKIFKSTIKQYDMIKQFSRELKIHYMLNHPNIIKLYGHFEDEYHVFLLMQYAEEGILPPCSKVEEKEASMIVGQVLDGVEYLHRNKIAHRDLKPQNIVRSNGTVKICDFGWASIFDDGMRNTFCGTLDYISPQMKDRGQYNNSVDLWSVGVLSFELLTGTPPYKSQIDRWRVKGSRMSDKWNWGILFPPDLTQYARDFINGLLREDPDLRSSIRECKNALFIKKYQQSCLENEEAQINHIL